MKSTNFAITICSRLSPHFPSNLLYPVFPHTLHRAYIYILESNWFCFRSQFAMKDFSSHNFSWSTIYSNLNIFQLENLVREMQDLEHGVPVRSQKLFLTSIPAAFMGKFLRRWLCKLHQNCWRDKFDQTSVSTSCFL